jgi:sulfate adenylyltransferase
MSDRFKPVAPHGGALVDRIVPEREILSFLEGAKALPRLVLDARELADLELIATGAASPLTGFLGREDYESVLSRLRLASGTVWPLPLTLAIPDGCRAAIEAAAAAALYDGTGHLWGTIQISSLFQRDPLSEARQTYGTDRADHPGVAYLLSRPTLLAGGTVNVLPLPELPFALYRFTPAALRERIRALGWRTVAGFQTRNPIHRAHEHLTKLALEVTDGLVIHPLVGETKGDDVPAAVRFRTYEALVARYYPSERTLLAAFPAAMRYAGPREALFHALVRKNYGITHLIVGRDHAGVGNFYPPTAAQEIFDTFRPEELGVTPLRLDPTFFCLACQSLASTRTCPHDDSTRLQMSGTRVREILASGGRLPEEFTRHETARILKAHYSSGRPPAGPDPRPRKRVAPGFVLWMTGLSGAGKSTLAGALVKEIAAEWPVEILDGDEVRTHLSKGLGFSKEDRDTNIRRIAWVARTLARNGVAVVAAAISPYRGARSEARAIARESGVPFVEVFARASLETLLARDVKGLYKKALAGEVKSFTGVSDPYEPPEAPEVTVDSSTQTLEESAAAILSHLREAGLLEAGGAEEQEESEAVA